jgi:hypothetical protein
MDVPATPANRALATAVSRRMRAEAREVNAKAALVRALGIGGACALAGIGVGAAFFGYSFITDASSSADRITAAMVEALEKTTLRTGGTVRLDSTGATVRLDAHEVALEAAPLKLDPGATVALDPEARLTVDLASAATPRPSPEQLKDNGAPPDPDKAKVVTDFTVFKNVAFGTGRVVTGWNFSSSEQKTPSYQYCYFTRDASGSVSTNTYLAVNGAVLTGLPAVADLDIAKAAAQCVWFDGAATKAASKTF